MTPSTRMAGLKTRPWGAPEGAPRAGLTETDAADRGKPRMTRSTRIRKQQRSVLSVQSVAEDPWQRLSLAGLKTRPTSPSPDRTFNWAIEGAPSGAPRCGLRTRMPRTGEATDDTEHTDCLLYTSDAADERSSV